jgi:membrane-associated phospholipid phosphatase
MTPAEKRLVLAAVALLAFVWLAEEVLHGRTLQFDNRVRMFVHAYANPALTALMRGISLIGDPGVLVALTVPVMVWFVRTGRARTVLMFAIAMAGAELLDQLLKLAFHRPRPATFFGLAQPMGYSFPSGHALVSLAFFGALAVFVARRRWLYYVAAAISVAAIGLSRVYLGMHYPTDVLGGWAAAAAWLFSVNLARR